MPNIQASIGPNTGRTHSGSERDFKKDLMKMLAKDGVPLGKAMKIFDYLQKGTDQQIGTKLRAMMSMQPPLIRPQLAESIAQAASANGVPSSSINKADLFKPISPEEAVNVLGGDLSKFMVKMDLSSPDGPGGHGIARLMNAINRSWMAA